MLKKYKFSCNIIGDIESGDYEARFVNLSNPDEDIDYSSVREFLLKVFKDLDNKEINNEEGFVKIIN